MQSPKVVAVVLAHNEEKTLPRTLQILKGFKGKGLISDLVVVNDGSTDNTVHIANIYTKHIITHDKNLGKREGFMSGAFTAKKLGAQVLVVLDADVLRFPEQSLRDMVNAVTTGRYGMAIAQQKELIDQQQPKDKHKQYYRVLERSSNAQRAFNMDALEPLFRHNKKWLEYLRTPVHAGARSITIKRTTTAQSAHWGLEKALDTLIPQKKQVFLGASGDFHDVKEHVAESAVYTHHSFRKVTRGIISRENAAMPQDLARKTIISIQKERMLRAAKLLKQRRTRIR